MSEILILYETTFIIKQRVYDKLYKRQTLITKKWREINHNNLISTGMSIVMMKLLSIMILICVEMLVY